MIIKDDYAEMETLDEYAVFAHEDSEHVTDSEEPEYEAHSFWTDSKIGRRQVLGALTPKKGDSCLYFDSPCWSSIGPPKILIRWTGKKINGEDCSTRYYVKANALTIGKTVGELRELLAWANC